MPSIILDPPLAIQHSFVENKTSQQDSIVYIAAMHAATSIYDTINSQLCDFSNTPKKPYFIYSEILVPLNTPLWVKDRSMLWNKLEAASSKNRMTIALEIKLSLPYGREHNYYIQMITKFVTQEIITNNLISDTSIHLSKPHEPHAHLLIPLLSLINAEFQPTESTVGHGFVNQITARWMAYQNTF